MAHTPSTPKTPTASTAEGAGTSTAPQPIAAAPGSPDFDVDGADEEALDEHLRLLEKRERIRKLTAGDDARTATAVTVGEPAGPAPGDIVALKDGEQRYFTQIAWDALETSGKHAGWEIAVPKPADKL